MSFGRYPDAALVRWPGSATQRRARLLATGTDPMAQRKAEKAAAENSFKA